MPFLLQSPTMKRGRAIAHEGSLALPKRGIGNRELKGL